MENEIEKEMKKVKNGKLVPIFLIIIALVGVFFIGKAYFLSLEINEPIDKGNIVYLLIFLFIVFCGFVGFSRSIEYDETHFEFKKSKSSESVCVNFSDIEKIQHYSYRAGRRTTNSYKVYLKDSEKVIELPYRQIDNKVSYEEFFEQILKQNPDVKFTKISSGIFSNKDEEILSLEQFI